MPKKPTPKRRPTTAQTERTTGNSKSKVGARAAAQNKRNMAKSYKKK